MVQPEVVSVDFAGGFLRFDIRNPRTQANASIWVDLGNRRIVKSIVAGQEMDVTPGRPFAVPMAKPR